MYKYLFGPVPSRRLGMSLGVDLVPKKLCSLDCVYCEVGKTTGLTTERKEYIPFDKIVSELGHYFSSNPDPDYITFSGSGEPTLNSRLGDVISFIKKSKPGIPVAVLTNGTLLGDKVLQQELLKADLVMPSLDAVSESTFNKINRPAEDLDLGKMIEGLVDFRKIFRGKIWLEIFILPGYNYDDIELIAFREAIIRIKPDSVQLNTLDRPGTEPGLVSASQAQMDRIKDIWALDNVEIIASTLKKHKKDAFRKDIENTILGTISRRPCTVEDLSEILNIPIAEISKYLRALETESKVKSVLQERGVFYQLGNREIGK